MNDKDVDMDENEEELSFIPSAVSTSACWYEPHFTCDRQCQKKRFKYSDVASVMVSDKGKLHTVDFRRDCHNLRRNERKQPVVDSRFGKLQVAEKRSRGKLAAGGGARGPEQKIMETCRP